MLRTVGILAAVLILGALIGWGWSVGSNQSVAQTTPTAVAAVPTDWVTTYDYNPFEKNELRRSIVSVTEVAIVWSDGRTELRDLKK